MSDDAASSGKSLGRSSAVMAAGTAVSRLLGFVRNWLLVGAVGATGMAANTFDLANKLPNMAFAIIAGGALNVVLVPLIVKAYRHSDAEDRVNRLLTLSGVLLLGITLLLTAGSSVIVALASGSAWSPAQRALGVTFTLWCMPQLFFYGVYTLLGQVLNARERFGPYMWAPVLNNVVSIVGFGAFIALWGWHTPTSTLSDPSSWTVPQIGLLAGTATIGVAAQALVLLWPLARMGFRFRLAWGPRGLGLRTSGKVALWTLAGLCLDQLGVFLTTRVAASADDAARTVADVAGNSAYSQALMIYLLPHSLVTVSILTAMFTSISASAQAGRRDLVRRDLSHGVRTVGTFTVIASALLIVLAEPLVRALVPSMTPGAVSAVGRVLVAMALGLVPFGAMVLMKWVFYAYEQGRTVFMLQVPVVLVLVGGSFASMWLLPGQWWVVGIGVSMSLSNVAGVLARSRSLRRLLGGVDGARIVRMHVRAVVAAAVAAVVGILVRDAVGGGASSGWLQAVLTCCVVGAAMAVVYYVGLRLMRVSEVDALAKIVRRVLRRR
ncbi:murein biosynthesis integral membrane protein MurJ [Sanguibacter hominis ATCC BAA-789]|uniref:Murein biosynthesis integral membrane protein MurJ n=1 Tax=Sanguibacter hominis ATCC BAA-789 TaxID=1312740 RepID=A0A9X5FF12_9MICO|nr:murein biosynthesis integral membrane protein MurJ [Sanguibacter hominis]NKX92791.1 murein biosynthesis integral membrane protein MurJ [Sanguibacter hominis ATCC BAA-789]